MNCTRCESSGFLNLHQVPEDVLKRFEDTGDHQVILDWMKDNESDVQVCDCCGNGESWHGKPGAHFEGGDARGPSGPYAYNGGLPECN